jgi:hypothetical protein
MQLLGKLTLGIGERIFNFFAAFLGVKYATRIVAVGTLATIYISCVLVFTSMIAPWLAAVFTTAYGALLGLLFPPIAGTVVASLMAYRTCVVGVRYTSRLLKMAVG